MEAIFRNKLVAYSGDIGKAREAFCVDLVAKKQKIFEEFRASQADIVARNSEAITCNKGCVGCCSAYMQATIQECETIVWWLYRHEDILSDFLAAYPGWRQKVRDGGDLFLKCGKLWQEKQKHGTGTEAAAASDSAEKTYLALGIPCPFLKEDACSIYEIRPLVCAALAATTPPEWCIPGTSNSAKMYVSSNPLMLDTSFYFNRLEGPVLAFMPMGVHGILQDGYSFLSGIPGLEGLAEKTP